MDAKQKELIRENYRFLIAELSGVIEKLCNSLHERKAISLSMKENILSWQKPSRKSSELLDLLIDRSAKAFHSLYESCKKLGLPEVSDILRPDKAPHVLKNGLAVSSQEETLLPDKWPTQEHHDRVKNDELVVKTVSAHEMIELYKVHLNRGDIYHLHHEIRGNCLIISNDVFLNTKFPPRQGSKWDKKGLEQLFKGLGFRVNTKNNLTVDEIRDTVKKECEENHSNQDCFVIYILTYGCQGILYGCDGKTITIKNIIESFMTVEDLKNKPKLFFFQACQDNNPRVHHHQQHIANPSDQDDVNLRNPDQNVSQETGYLPADLEIPLYNDVYIFRSSPDGELSRRHTLLGSWFTQAVVKIFAEYAHICHLTELSTKVNALLSKGETVSKEKNTAEARFSSHKKLYFFPGLYN